MFLNKHVEHCYITSTLTTHKERKDEIIGPCGPCSFINLIGLDGSFELEKKLAEMGRMKPFYASNFTSFLIWSEYFNKEIEVYVENPDISEGTFNMIFKYEKIPKEKQKELKEECLRRHSQIIQKNKDKIHILKDKPLKVIDDLLSRGYAVAFNMADYFDKDFLVGHSRVCYQKKNSVYYIKDSREGILKFSKKQMEEQLNNVKKMKGTFDIIGYKV